MSHSLPNIVMIILNDSFIVNDFGYRERRSLKLKDVSADELEKCFLNK